jgi:cobalt-zinc-cadmium efflux system protein
VIIYSSWSLLKESLRLSLDGVPKGINLENIKSQILSISGVLDIHHIHVWAMSSTQNALTAHVVIDENIDSTEWNSIKQQIKHELEHAHIRHITLETEYSDQGCKDADCSFI